MYREVKIGETKVPMKATASVDLRYKQTFRADPFRVQTAADWVETGAKLVFIRQMGYIMAQAAAGRDMSTLSEEDFADWLDQYDHGDFVRAMPAIWAVYEGNDAPPEDQGNPNGE